MCIGIRFGLITVAVLFLQIVPAQANNNPQVYSFGVVPQQSAKRLAKLWGPVLSYISADSGITLRFKTAKNIPEFERRMAQGEYQFAYMNPYHFTVFSRTSGYSALVVRKDQPISGIVVVRKDSPIQSIDELEGKALAFPSPAAFAASVLPREKLARDNISFTHQYVSSHDSVYLNVAKGLFAAGGGVKRTLNNTDTMVSEQLRILWQSKPYTPHAIAAHTSVDSNIQQRIQQSFVRMVNDPKGKALLATLKIKHGLINATNDDWDDVRRLGLDVLDKLIYQ